MCLDKVTAHNFDKKTFANDIAILELTKPLKYSDSVRPICLPSAAASSLVGKPVMVAGWGQTSGEFTNTDFLVY